MFLGLFFGITALIGTIAASGLSLFVLGFFGAGAAIIGFMALKHIPWRVITIAALVLFTMMVATLMYVEFKHTQEQLVAKSTELQRQKDALQQEKIARQQEKARADSYVAEHDAQVARIEALEKDRTQIEDEAASLQVQLNEMHLQQDFTHDSAKAVANLNARNADLDRMLVNATQGKRRNATASGHHAAARPGPIKAGAAAPLF